MSMEPAQLTDSFLQRMHSKCMFSSKCHSCGPCQLCCTIHVYCITYICVLTLKHLGLVHSALAQTGEALASCYKCILNS